MTKQTISCSFTESNHHLGPYDLNLRHQVGNAKFHFIYCGRSISISLWVLWTPIQNVSQIYWISWDTHGLNYPIKSGSSNLGAEGQLEFLPFCLISSEGGFSACLLSPNDEERLKDSLEARECLPFPSNIETKFSEWSDSREFIAFSNARTFFSSK